MMRRGPHTIRHRSQFLWMCLVTENTAKKVLRIRQKPAYSSEHNSRKFFAKRSQIWRITLYTLYEFHPFVLFLSLFTNSVLRAWVYFFSSREKSLWVRHGDRSPGETRRTEFCKKSILQNAVKHLLHTTRGAYQFRYFVPVSLWFANSV